MAWDGEGNSIEDDGVLDGGLDGGMVVVAAASRVGEECANGVRSVAAYEGLPDGGSWATGSDRGLVPGPFPLRPSRCSRGAWSREAWLFPPLGRYVVVPWLLDRSASSRFPRPAPLTEPVAACFVVDGDDGVFVNGMPEVEDAAVLELAVTAGVTADVADSTGACADVS